MDDELHAPMPRSAAHRSIWDDDHLDKRCTLPASSILCQPLTPASPPRAREIRRLRRISEATSDRSDDLPDTFVRPISRMMRAGSGASGSEDTELSSSSPASSRPFLGTSSILNSRLGIDEVDASLPTTISPPEVFGNLEHEDIPEEKENGTFISEPPRQETVSRRRSQDAKAFGRNGKTA